MAAIKSYTDMKQSKKLAEILPLESADMYWFMDDTETPKIYPKDMMKNSVSVTLPCWSLTALLEILDYPQLSRDKLGSGKVGWMVSVYPNDCRYNSCLHDNPVDACVEMILKLNELNLL